MAEPISTWLGYPESSHFVSWFGWLIGIDTLAVIPFAWLRFEHKALRFASLKLVNILVNVGLNYFFLWYCPLAMAGEFLLGKAFIARIYDPELGKGYVFLSNLMANALYIPLLLPVIKHWRFRFCWPEMKAYYAYGLPLLVSGVAYAINETADRILLKYWLPTGFYEGLSNLSAVGVYNACYKLSIFITLAVQGFKYAAEPFFFAKGNDQNSPETFARVMKYFLISTLAMMALVTANLHWVAPIFLKRPEYLSGLGIVPILLLANIFLGAYYNLSIWFKITDKTFYGSYISIFGAAITLLANFLLIPQLGYTGSALATLACYLSITVASYYLGKKQYPIPYPMAQIMLYLIGFSGLTSLYYLSPFTGWQASLAHNGAVGCALLLTFLFEKQVVYSRK